MKSLGLIHFFLRFKAPGWHTIEAQVKHHEAGDERMERWGQIWKWSGEYFRYVRPEVARALAPIRSRAMAIPQRDLQNHALSSLNTKQFHCEGGGVFASPSRDRDALLLPFLIPYQTLCDYLDTITDRGPSQDSKNLRQLHQALVDAIDPNAAPRDYYAYHPHKNDRGYIDSLVKEAQSALTRFPGFWAVKDSLRQLVSLYVDLQVFKHGPTQNRVEQLTNWHKAHSSVAPGLSWWEFSASTGSTLGLFALLNLASTPNPGPKEVDAVIHLYFPWMGALHILLDYYVDQEEDRLGGDLNFVTYYPSPQKAIQGIRRIYDHIIQQAPTLPDGAFHRYIAKGLLGFYLSDPKLRHRTTALNCQLLASGGTTSLGLYLAARVGRSP